MKFFYFFIFALFAVQSVFAADVTSVKAKLQALDNQCDKFSKLSSSITVTVSVAATIEAEIVAIITALVNLQAEINAYVGVFAEADAEVIIDALADIEGDISAGIAAVIALKASLTLIGENTKCGQDLLNLQVAINAFIGVFLGSIPSASKDSAKSVCKNLQSDATKGCQAYSTCS